MFKKLKQDIFLKNLAYVGSGEFVNRIARLGTTVVLARVLTQGDYGEAAIALIVTDFVRSFFLTGFGIKLLQVPPNLVDSYANTCYYLGLILSLIVFLIQSFIGIYMGITNDWSIGIPVIVMGIMFPIISIGQTQGKLLYRENKQKELTRINTGNFIVSCIMQVTFALLGFKMWSIILPQILSSILWSYKLRKGHPWRPNTFSIQHYKDFILVGGQMIGIDLLNKWRTNVDYIVIGAFLGKEALGLYYFAFNAGLGISLSVIRTTNTVLLAHLSPYKDNLVKLKVEYKKAIKNILKVSVPIVILQCSTAYFYVPIVFGEKWMSAVPILIIICLSALPRPLGEASEALLNSVEQTKVNLYFNIIFSLIFSVSIIAAAYLGIQEVAITVAVTHFIILPIYFIWSYKHVFKI